MSKISLEPNASGAGTFSIVSPDSNTNRTLNLPDEAGKLLSTGNNDPAEVFKQSNILGTVSESGGVPTGGIIERGSNSNGEFVKYADGTQICFYSDRGDDIGDYYNFLGLDPDSYESHPVFNCSINTSGNWTFPVSFSSRPYSQAFMGFRVTSSQYSIPRVYQTSTTSANVHVENNFQTTTTFARFGIFAVGKWY